MNEGIDPAQERIVGAVQRELSRFGTEIADRFAELQRHTAAEASARSALESRVVELTAALATTDADLRGTVAGVQINLERLEMQIEARLGGLTDANDRHVTEFARVVGRFDERATALEEGSQSAEHRIASMVERADAAANGLTERVARFDEDRVAMDARLDRLDRRRNEAVERLDVVEERLGGIDEIVSDATVGIADRVEHLAAALEAMTTRTTEELETLRAEMAETDADAIDELKERVSSALGQAELVRIEMDRFRETMKNDLDTNVSRLTAIETAVQDQRMDVETAVQLERLEEVERMVLMLDPAIAAQGASRSAATAESPDDDWAFGIVPEAVATRTGAPSLPRLAPSVGF